MISRQQMVILLGSLLALQICAVLFLPYPTDQVQVSTGGVHPRAKVITPQAQIPSVHQQEEQVRVPSSVETRSLEAKLPIIRAPGSRRGRYAKCTPTSRCLVHLHIGKNGGTSIDTIGNKLSDRFIGGKHFDWSFIQGTIGMENADVILMLREPVSRSLSHFYFTKQVYGSPKMRSSTLSQFLSDPAFLLEERGIWQDGQAAVSWITGTHIANWCAVPSSQVPLREELSMPSPELLNLAADRLEQTIWFGILEDVSRSMELLQHALGLKTRPELPQRNKARKATPVPTEAQVNELRYLTPMDRWLYSYGLELFEARWEAYQNNSTTVNLPQRPPYPDIPCWSTRFELHCDRGPLKGNHTWRPRR